jgi:hypothetical protein
VRLFDKIANFAAQPVTPVATPTEPILLFMKANGITATGDEAPEGYVARSESQAVGTIGASLPERDARLRRSLIGSHTASAPQAPPRSFPSAACGPPPSVRGGHADTAAQGGDGERVRPPRSNVPMWWPDVMPYVETGLPSAVCPSLLTTILYSNFVVAPVRKRR